MNNNKILITSEFETLFDYDYDQESPPEKKTFIGKEHPRKICYFCGEQEGNASFKKEAHIIPESLGNRYLLSNEECDICNGRSGETIDTDFISAMTSFRFNARIRGKDGRIKIRHPARKSFIHTSTLDDEPRIEQYDGEDNIVRIIDDNTLEVKIFVPGHRPIGVPKQLARLGFFVSEKLRQECDPIYKEWLRGEKDIFPMIYFHSFIPGPGLRKTRLTVFECINQEVNGNCKFLVSLSFTNVNLYFHVLKNPFEVPTVFPLPPLGKSPYPPHDVNPKMLKVVNGDKTRSKFEIFKMHYSSSREGLNIESEVEKKDK
jgi:hypothetical protein